VVADRILRISRHLGLTIDRQLSGGSFGAFLAVTPGGARVVLKVLPHHPVLRHDRVVRAAACAETVRNAGGPVPRHLDVGTWHGDVFTVQEFVAGEVPAVLTLAVARELTECWRLQLDAAAEQDGGWASEVTTALVSGTEEVFVDHAVLRQAADPRVRALLDAAVEVGRGIRPGVLRGGDVMHGDFHHRNILVRDGRLVAVLDWENARVGDARFDLAALTQIIPPEEAEPAARAFLDDQVARAVPAEIRRVVLALGTLQRLTFAVRSRPDLLEWALARAADLAREDDTAG
jgi:hypothetical protein